MSSLIKKHIQDDFNDVGWMQAVNVSENPNEFPDLSKVLSETIDEIIQNLITENPGQVYDKHGNTIISCSDGPAIAFFLLIDRSLNKEKWFYDDHRNGGSAWHENVRVIDTPDFPNATRLNKNELRGRLWPELKICSWYQSEKNAKPYFKNIEDLFELLKLDIKEYQFEFASSASTEGLKPWPGASGPAKKIEVPPDIQRKLDILIPQLHFAVGDEKAKIEREIEDLYKKAGIENAKAAEKSAYISARGEKITPFEKGAGSVAGYKGRFPAIAEAKVQVYNKTLCPDIWEGEKLNPEIRDGLLKIAFDFYTDTELKTKIQDVYLLGSIANYNWTPKSDMDVHIIIDSATLSMHPENAEKFFRSLVGKWNIEHDIKIKGHKVELYLQDIREKNAATGVYSIVHDDWIKKPTPEDVSIDKKSIQLKYSMWVDRINDAVRLEDEKKLKQILETLREYRQSGLDKQGEFSTENLVFKILRSRGYLEKLKDGYNQIYDKKMAIKDGFDPTSVGPNPEASEGQQNGAFYQQQNRRMRQMESITMKNIRSRHPTPFTPQKNDGSLDFEQMTMENLKAILDKAKRFYLAAKAVNDKGEIERAKAVYKIIHTELKRRINYIKADPLGGDNVNEGYGGIPEKDRLKIPNDDGSVRRWQIRSKDAPKTPKMTDSLQELVNEVLDDMFNKE